MMCTWNLRVSSSAARSALKLLARMLQGFTADRIPKPFLRRFEQVLVITDGPRGVDNSRFCRLLCLAFLLRLFLSRGPLWVDAMFLSG